jgi:hypothetical protein
MLVSFLIATLIVLFLFGLNWRRAKVETQFELTPNCLLTRHPIVFLTGRRSLFYFLSYWNEIPAFLTAHGYQVYILPLPWKPKAALPFLRQYFRRRRKDGEKFHFVIDSSLRSLFEELLQEDPPAQIASLSCVGFLHREETPHFLNGKSSLQALKVPIEDIATTEETQPSPWWWKLHLLFAGRAQYHSVGNLGWPFVRSQCEQFLKQVTLLAERDLLQDD